MNIIKTADLACPIDNLILSIGDRQLICANGHSFDIARQGHVNLLLVQQKRSKHPGDSKAMVVARTQFLDSGTYQPVADNVAGIVAEQITADKDICLLDAGCGEGYYLDYIFQYLSGIEEDKNLTFIGLDISKEAILHASKRNKNITWVVGTNRQPPVVEASVDIILCVFGFVSLDGFYKILKPGGKLILVDPGPEHLIELREIIYEKVKTTNSEYLVENNNSTFSIIDNQQCQFKTGVLNNDAIKNLLTMTPHLFRASKSGKEAAEKIQELDLTVDMVIRVLVKK